MNWWPRGEEHQPSSLAKKISPGDHEGKCPEWARRARYGYLLPTTGRVQWGEGASADPRIAQVLQGGAQIRIQVDSHLVLFNREATRWLGICLASRLSYTEHTMRCVAKARAAERRLNSVVTPPLSKAPTGCHSQLDAHSRGRGCMVRNAWRGVSRGAPNGAKRY